MSFNTQFTPYPEQLAMVEALAPASVAAAGATNGSALDINEFEGNIAIVVQCAQATAGITPTNTFTVEHRINSSDTWAAVPSDALIAEDGSASAFAVVTDAANGGLQKRGLVRARCKAQIRVVATVAGTSSPSFKFSAALVGSKKYGHQ